MSILLNLLSFDFKTYKAIPITSLFSLFKRILFIKGHNKSYTNMK